MGKAGGKIMESPGEYKTYKRYVGGSEIKKPSILNFDIKYLNI